jgi:hypothetical protein
LIGYGRLSVSLENGRGDPVWELEWPISTVVGWSSSVTPRATALVAVALLVVLRRHALSSSVEVECEAVDAQGVGEQVEGLAVSADAVGPAEPEGVVEVAVDAFGVVATAVEAVEVRGRRVGSGERFRCD